MEPPRAQAERLERQHPLPPGSEERFNGYGVMAAPFRSGHLLALRRFPASSVGPGYTSVWHHAPDGRWTMYSDVAPAQACPRYFGAALDEARHAVIHLEWTGPQSFTVHLPEVPLLWEVTLQATPTTRAFSRLGNAMPARWWRSPRVLGAMEPLAGRLLHAGHLGLHGRAPNGQSFVANPRTLWLVARSRAILAGQSLGELGPLPEQVRLGDFWIPQRGLFAFGQAFFHEAAPVH
jgi:hypothetical protein